MAEHLSFRIGNQLFFVFIEVPGVMLFDDRAQRLLSMVADEAKGIPCLLRVRKTSGGYAVANPGWGLVHACTGRPVNPPALVSDELIEMTDWEIHDLAVQVVRATLTAEGKNVLLWQPSPHINPSLWLLDGDQRQYVIVKGSRWPSPKATPTPDHRELAKALRETGNAGHFASVGVANAEDTCRDADHALPLYRGHSLKISHQGFDMLMP
jgi:hypothetical protein